MLVQMKIGKQANGNASPIKRWEGEQIEDRQSYLRQGKAAHADFEVLIPFWVISRRFAAPQKRTFCSVRRMFALWLAVRYWHITSKCCRSSAGLPPHQQV
jgi:hypothetical protein